MVDVTGSTVATTEDQHVARAIAALPEAARLVNDIARLGDKIKPPTGLAAPDHQLTHLKSVHTSLAQLLARLQEVMSP